jgi:hypothetical protein
VHDGEVFWKNIKFFYREESTLRDKHYMFNKATAPQTDASFQIDTSTALKAEDVSSFFAVLSCESSEDLSSLAIFPKSSTIFPEPSFLIAAVPSTPVGTAPFPVAEAEASVKDATASGLKHFPSEHLSQIQLAVSSKSNIGIRLTEFHLGNKFSHRCKEKYPPRN